MSKRSQQQVGLKNHRPIKRRKLHARALQNLSDGDITFDEEKINELKRNVPKLRRSKRLQGAAPKPREYEINSERDISNGNEKTENEDTCLRTSVCVCFHEISGKFLFVCICDFSFLGPPKHQTHTKRKDHQSKW